MNFTSRAVVAISTAVAASCLLLFLLLAGADGRSAQAQTGGAPTPTPTQDDAFDFQDLPALKGKVNPPKYENMDSILNRIVQQVETREVSVRDAARGAPLHQDDSVAVTLYITEGYADALSDFLEGNGASQLGVGTDYIEAYIPVSLLASASRQKGVISIETIFPPPSPPPVQPEQGVAAQGAVVSQGVAVHGVPSWHRAGFKGAGVKIGVFDVGYRSFSRLMGTELPSSVHVKCIRGGGRFSVSTLSRCPSVNRSDHGTATTETIFDIAPEATYYISELNTGDNLKSGVAWMVSQGVDVINHSGSWWWQGPGDGTYSSSNSHLSVVDAAVAGGIVWVNSAGNTGKATWFGEFTDTDEDGFHDYSGDECNSVFLSSGSSNYIQLRWDDSWSGANKDLDLYVYDSSARTTIVASSENTQAGNAGNKPYELISYRPTVSGNFCLAVRQDSGETPAWIQLQAYYRPATLQHRTSHHSIGNPAESANSGMLAVGSSHWNYTGTIDSRSSRGPTTDGRIKPDIVGAHCARTAIISAYCGTSQAAPHVAGLAALVKQRFPSYSPAQIANYLKTNADARGTVPNNTWGYGFAKLPPISTATPSPTPTVPPRPTRTPRPTATATPSPTPTATATATPTPTATPTATPSPTPTATATATPTPTATPTATPSPTPTATATPSPTPTATPTPTPTPVDPCVTPIYGDAAIDESWGSDCVSENDVDSGAFYARFYTFTLVEPADVTITLTSDIDTYLYLMRGARRDGEVLRQNNDFSGLGTNSRIVASLAAGIYTIEATTFATLATGDFILTVEGLGQSTVTPPPPAPSPTPTPTPIDPCVMPIDGDATISGAWTSDCVSENDADIGAFYARFYTFTLVEPADITITLASDIDTYLYLLSGAGKDGATVRETADPDGTSSRIQATLQAGAYTIEATTYNASVTGDFTLTVEGLGQITVAPPVPTPSPTPRPSPSPVPSPTPPPSPSVCTDTLSGASASVIGAWTSDCVSANDTDIGAFYARFYTFTLSKPADVTITLKSDINTYLYLMRGAGKNGEVLRRNDDFSGLGTNSRIVASLTAGSYTIEATTYAQRATGNFTLTVEGLEQSAITPSPSGGYTFFAIR